jgi:hypothetical protein
MADYLRDAIQRLLDESGDGWTVTQFVVAMGIERINPDGSVECVAWHWSPRDQPHWQSLGLLERGVEAMQSESFYEDDEY